MASPTRVRFAPAPTGRLHLGGARTALVNALAARSRGGVLVLRIEDTDAERNLPGAAEALAEDLAWLGIVPDESPERGGGHGPYRQSERAALYEAALERLRRGGHVYRCWCGPEARAERGCPGGCGDLGAAEGAARAHGGTAPAWRFRLGPERVVRDLLRGEVSFKGAPAPDPVLVRPDGRPTFLFACAVDDVEMEISHVIRGEDHLPNAWKQEQIQRALGQRPPRWAHLPLVLGPDGAPLSKRHGALAIAELRERGVPWEAVVLALAHLGWTPPAVPPGADPWPVLARSFRLDRLSTAQPVHDEGRLRHLSGRWLRALPPEELAARAARLGRTPPGGPARADWWGALLKLLARSCPTLSEAAELGCALLSASPAPAGPEARAVLEAWLELWPEAGLDGPERFKTLARQVSERSGATGRALFHPLRLALTGRGEGPALAELAPILDRAAADGAGVAPCRERIAAARRAA